MPLHCNLIFYRNDYRGIYSWSTIPNTSQFAHCMFSYIGKVTTATLFRDNSIFFKQMNSDRNMIVE